MAKKPELYDIGTGYQSRVQLNENFRRIQEAFENTVSRDGSVPNEMSADFDMNSNDILNVNKVFTKDVVVNGVSIGDMPNVAADLFDQIKEMYEEFHKGLYIQAFAVVGENGQTVLDKDVEGNEIRVTGNDALVSIHGIGDLLKDVDYKIEEGVITLTEPLNYGDLVKVTVLPRISSAEAQGVVQDAFLARDDARDAADRAEIAAASFYEDKFGYWDAVAMGVANDGVTPCADAIEAAAQRIADAGGGILFFREGRYLVERTAYIPWGVSAFGVSPVRTIEGRPAGAVFVPSNSGEYILDYLLFFNVNKENPETWVRSFPNDATYIDRMSYDAGTSTKGLNFVYCAGAYKISGMQTRKVATAVGRPNLYVDGMTVCDIHASERANTTDYLISLLGLGDKTEIRNVATGYIGFEDIACKGVYATNIRGGFISGLVNGHHEFHYLQGTPIFGCHIEMGSITLASCDNSVFDNMFFRTAEGSGQIFVTSVGTGNAGIPSLQNNQFVTFVGWGAHGPMTLDSGDIVFSGAGRANLLGNKRVHSYNGALYTKGVLAAKVELPTVGLDNDYNRYSWGLTEQPVMVSARGVNLRHNLESKDFSGTGLNTPSIVNVNSIGFSLPQDTYYYRARLVIDQTRRISRSFGAEVSVNVNVPNRLVGIGINYGDMISTAGFCLRVYRGTSPDTYDAYADVNILSLPTVGLIDDGETLMGVPWQSRTAGAMDAYNSNGLDLSPMVNGENITISTLGAVPTAGTWKAGDLILRVPSANAGNFRAIRHTRLTDGSGWVYGVDYVTDQTFAPASGFFPVRRVNAPPATLTSGGTVGDRFVQGDSVYECVDTNQWSRGVIIEATTSADLNDAASRINTVNKIPGRLVQNRSTGELLSASGTSATAAWNFVNTNTPAYTPS